jgi:D-arabinose 1-dehydrogenase-like Zn-dependent alcohol dehydrogenase
MSNKFHAYAASTPHALLEPFNFDPGALGPEEVEIQASHCGVCHSDLSMLDNEWGMSQFPFVPGHEAVGTIVAPGIPLLPLPRLSVCRKSMMHSTNFAPAKPATASCS